MMRLLADENFPRFAVDELRAAGHDVLWVRTDSPGAEDEVILGWAQAESRIVVTFDKDFGKLAFRFGLPATCGVILFRLATTSPQIATARVRAAIDSRIDWSGL